MDPLAKTETGPDEFAIEIPSKFNFVPSGTSVVIHNDGSVIITLNFQLAKGFNTCGPNSDISTFDSAVFQMDDPAKYFNSVEVSQLALTQDQNNNIVLGSNKGDIALITDGDKGRQGNLFIIE